MTFVNDQGYHSLPPVVQTDANCAICREPHRIVNEGELRSEAGDAGSHSKGYASACGC